MFLCTIFDTRELKITYHRRQVHIAFGVKVSSSFFIIARRHMFWAKHLSLSLYKHRTYTIRRRASNQQAHEFAFKRLTG